MYISIVLFYTLEIYLWVSKTVCRPQATEGLVTDITQGLKFKTQRNKKIALLKQYWSKSKYFFGNDLVLDEHYEILTKKKGFRNDLPSFFQGYNFNIKR